MSLEWKGAPEISAAIEQGLRTAAEALLDDARARTPRGDSGDLRSSGVASADGDEGAVSFDTEYAVRQHYRLDYEHDDGQALYLQTAAMQFGEQLEQILGEQIGRVIGE